MTVSNLQALVIYMVDNAIYWINLYPVDNVDGINNTYPLDSDLSGLLRYRTVSSVLTRERSVQLLRQLCVNKAK